MRRAANNKILQLMGIVGTIVLTMLFSTPANAAGTNVIASADEGGTNVGASVDEGRTNVGASAGMMWIGGQIRQAAEVLEECAEEICGSVKEAARDPQRSDKIRTATGKILSKSDGKWVIPAEGPASDKEAVIVFAGDIIFERSQNPGIAKIGDNGIRDCFDDETWEIMHDADLLVINNEFPYTDRGSATPGKQFTFRCDPETVEWFADMGTDLAALANNHIYDYGEEGAMDTFDTLDGAGIPYIGAGRDLEDAQKTAYYLVNGMSVAILNATEIERYDNPDTKEAGEDSPGVFRCLYDDDLCDQVRKAKEHADIVIVYVHWGTELMPSADGRQYSIAEDLADAGADVIVGSHPHILQNIEYVDGVPVFYSLGNYFFSASTRDNGVLRITLDTEEAKVKSLQFIPMVQQQGVKTLDGADKERVLDTMRSLSPGVSIDDDGFFEESP